MKTSKSIFSALFIIFLSNMFFAQTNRVLVTVDWPDFSYENRVDVFDPANNLLVSICNEEECYQTTSTAIFSEYQATYDLGCLATDPIALPNYYLVLYDANNDGWDASFTSSSVTVNVGGVDVVTNDGSSASTSGFQVDFNVNSTNLCTLPDSDQDGVVDRIDQDDDNDGILDISEGLGINNFDCNVPSLNFNSGFYESGGSGSGDDVGSIYRFVNALTGYDVLVEITEIDNTVLLQMDDDTVDNADFLQTELEFTGTGTPGITFQFTIVDTGTSTPASTIFRIGGTTWDCDGTADLQESVRYFNPSAYGIDNPTSLSTDTYLDGAGVTAGTVTFNGFSTNTILRSYFQFLNNTFTIRMQAQKTSSFNDVRLYAMSFTQCDIFDYEAPILTILNGQDTDGDNLDNELDLDSDNDGIPDNVELQPTATYIAPNNVYDPISGIDTAYIITPALTDTDGDNIPDFIDSDSDGDGTPDIEENGMANAIVTFTDTDNDGLDNLFEGANINDPTDVNDEIDNPSSSVLPDTDGDLLSGGDLDYRDASDFGSASVDFDGIDDYLDSASILGGLNEVTIMGWVKLDATFNSDAILFGQDNFILEVDGTTRVLTTTVNGNSETSSDVLPLNQWVHIAAFYSSSPVTNGIDARMVRTYLNGSEISSNNGALLNGGLDASSVSFTIGKNAASNTQHFKGAIDEVRVFDVVLTESQIRRMMYQEIQQNGLNVGGTLVPEDIVDNVTNATISWTNLQAYYPMTNIAASKTQDISSYSRDASLYNITTIQPQTAPMPYESATDGSWSDASTWLHGDVWDITGSVSSRAVSTIKNWAIVRIRSNVSVPFSVRSLAMFIDSGSSLTVTGNNYLDNIRYFVLNGTLDLEGDSQLIQGVNSDLVTSATGRILRRQEGNNNAYWYNYWSSPIGTVGATSFTNNNGASNNTNNTSFNIGMLEDGAGAAMEFTSALDEAGKISNRWLYSFQNGQTYFDWVALTPASAIAPGIGYTQKGTGNSGTEQQYIFNGKPNNGTILVPADDVDGDSLNESEQDVTLTTTLIGNPYPSALDARIFITDNSGVIGGSVYVWEQWGGTSHILENYEGGYGTINLVTTEKAYQFNDPTQTESSQARKPTFYIPVAQGFFVEAVEDGDIEFNNGQRVFILESDADTGSNPDPNNGSIFFRNTETVSRVLDNEISMMRLELNVSNGNKRSFVLAFSDQTTDGFDYGYDARTIDPQDDDMNSFIGDEKMLIQTLSPITDDKVIDLVLNTTGTHDYTLGITEMTGLDEDQTVYLRDNLTGIYFDLRSGAYSFSSDINGEDAARFDIVFKNDQTLSNDDVLLEGTVIFANSKEHKLYVKGLTETAKVVSLTNMLGQTVKVFQSPETNTLENGLYIGELSSGVYLVNLITETNSKLNKKIILE